MEQTVTLTLENVGIMFLYLATGYLLRRKHILRDDASKTMSTLVMTLFSPAYTITNLSRNFTMDKLGEKSLILGFGLIFTLVAIVLGRLLSKLFARDDFERKTYHYAFTFPNYGYFGYPVVAGVFGEEMLADMMIFCIPFAIACSTYGYILFSPSKKLTVKGIFSKPIIIANILGVALGLSGIQLPEIINGVLQNASNCMSPVSMILGGFVLGSFPLKKLLTGIRSYWLSAIRLVGIPLAFGVVLLLCGVRGIYLLLPMIVTALPLGMNLVVYPESYGLDSSPNARMCFASYLMAIVTLPLSFGVFTLLAAL